MFKIRIFVMLNVVRVQECWDFAAFGLKASVLPSFLFVRMTNLYIIFGSDIFKLEKMIHLQLR